MALEFTVNDVSSDVRDSMLRMGKPMAAAATEAINIAGSTAVTLGRGDIGQAGFGARWQNTWRVNFYQVTPPQIDAAAWLYHKIPFAEIFEDGGTIVGKPMLWVPLRNAPLSFGQGKKHLSPKSLIQRGVKLFSIERAGKPPLLATKIWATQSQAGRTAFNVTAKKILAGRVTPKKGVGNLVRMTVPLFFGIRQVHERKRFHLKALAQTQIDALPNYYDAALGALADAVDEGV
jgi:hypothetical protein